MKIIIFLILLNSIVRAEVSMKKCTLLPITDSVDGAISFKIFEATEDFLKNSDWCEYKSNSGLISIFDKYRNNLKSHLSNPQVIKTVSQNLNVGTIIRISLDSYVGGVDLEIDVIGENGEDIYFNEKVKLNNDNIELLISTVKNWLNLYEKNIPYDGRITGILGDQLTINVGKNHKVKIGNDFTIKRPITKKRHPLLKQIVEWETDILAKGKIFSVSEEQSLAMVKIYTKDQKLNVGDWVLVDRKSGDFESKVDYPEIKDNEFGKLGLLTVTLDLLSSNFNSNISNTPKEAGGLMLGFDILAELWATRMYFAMFEFSQRFGSISPSAGSFAKDDIGMTNNKLKLLGGYKYLPMGYFYGPQIDAYAGITTYKYSPDKSSSDGLGENEFSGYTIGVRGNIPVHNLIRFIARIEMLIFSDYKDSSGVTGDAADSSTLEIELGARYSFNELFSLDFYIEKLDSKATFGGNISEVHYQDTILKLGSTLRF